MQFICKEGMHLVNIISDFFFKNAEFNFAVFFSEFIRGAALKTPVF